MVRPHTLISIEYVPTYKIKIRKENNCSQNFFDVFNSFIADYLSIKSYRFKDTELHQVRVHTYESCLDIVRDLPQHTCKKENQGRANFSTFNAHAFEEIESAHRNILKVYRLVPTQDIFQISEL